MASDTTPPFEGYTIYDPVDPFENRAGPFYWKHLPDCTHHFALRATERHCNSHGIVHGGLMMTMIDLSMVIACKGTDGEQLVTISMNSDFIAAGHAGDIIEAHGTVTRRTRTLAFVTGRVESQGRTLLTASGVFKTLYRAAPT
jgi:acyl-coenzyme A thioesterase 13